MLQQRGSAALHQVWEAAAPVGSRGLWTIKGASSKTFERLRATPWLVLARRRWKLLLGIGAVILLSIGLISVGLIVWKVPQWQAATWEGRIKEAKDLAKLENDARTALIQAIGGAVLLLGFLATAIGLVLTWRNLQITQNTVLKNLQLTQDRQITDHYTRAVEHLGSDKLEVQLGAIYALERIARDSERDHWPIMEILTTYVREHAPWPSKDIPPLADDLSPTEKSPQGKDQPLPKLAADIQAILTVIGRRTRTFGKGEDQRLNLSSIDLRYADLRRAQLQAADLLGSRLQKADLRRAQLQAADLLGAQLQGATLSGAQLQGADLTGADLEGADLPDADLEGAHLVHAQLQEAFLYGAQLQGIVMSHR
jgi:Pentapeptide repeats (8 copies)